MSPWGVNLTWKIAHALFSDALRKSKLEAPTAELLGKSSAKLLARRRRHNHQLVGWKALKVRTARLSGKL